MVERVDPIEKFTYYVNILRDQMKIENKKINIKISGDGTYAAKNLYVINFNFSLLDLNSIKPNTVKGNFNLGIFQVDSEKYEVVKKALEKFVFDLSQIKNIKIDKENKYYDVEFYLSGDLKFLAMMLGISNANGEHPCIWCTNSKKNFINDCVMDRILENSKLGEYGYLREPIINFIKYENIILDTLHMFLRISDKLEEYLLKDLELLDKSFSENLENLPNKKKYFDFLLRLKIKKPYYIDEKTKKVISRSLNGTEKKKLFMNIDLTNLFPELKNKENKSKLWKIFYQTYLDINKNEISYENLKKITNDWLQMFVEEYSRLAVTPYMHAFKVHLHQMNLNLNKNNLAINFFNCEGLEKFNDLATKYYHRSTNKREKYLEQLIKKRIRIELLNFDDFTKYHKNT
jgi:hypothetical protein